MTRAGFDAGAARERKFASARSAGPLILRRTSVDERADEKVDPRGCISASGRRNHWRERPPYAPRVFTADDCTPNAENNPAAVERAGRARVRGTADARLVQF